MEEGLIKKLITSLKCTSCGQYYQAGDVDILGHEDDLWFFKATCLTCHTEFLVAAVVQEDRGYKGLRPSGAETPQFKKMGKITAADVLNMHHFLQQFDGDFYRIFNKSRL